MIPADSLQTSVPAIPIAKPTSAFFKAGASLVPSPVTATTFSNYFKPVTKINLSSGVDLANTLKCFAIVLNLSRHFTSVIISFGFYGSGTCTTPPTFIINFIIRD